MAAMHALAGASSSSTYASCSRSRSASMQPHAYATSPTPRATRPLILASCSPSPSSTRHLAPSTSGRFAGSGRPARGAGVRCQGLFGLGIPELAVIAGVAVLVFGPSKLPEVGKSLGKTLKSFQSAAKEFESELKSASADDPAAVPPPAGGTKPQDDERAK